MQFILTGAPFPNVLEDSKATCYKSEVISYSESLITIS